MKKSPCGQYRPSGRSTTRSSLRGRDREAPSVGTCMAGEVDAEAQRRVRHGVEHAPDGAELDQALGVYRRGVVREGVLQPRVQLAREGFAANHDVGLAREQKTERIDVRRAH